MTDQGYQRAWSFMQNPRDHFLYIYRLGQRKSQVELAEARQAGLYPWQPPQNHEHSTDTSPEVRSGSMGVIDIERWRLRAGQEEDEELAPFLVCLEHGELAMRKTCNRKTAELMVQELDEYEVAQGLLVHKVRTTYGQVTKVPVILDGSARSIIW